MNCEILLYVFLFLFSPAIVVLCLLFSYIFITPILCLWATTFDLLGWKKPLELAKKHMPEMFYGIGK